MFKEIIPTIILAATVFLAITPTIVSQITKEVPRGIQKYKNLLAVSLWSGVCTILLVVLSVVWGENLSYLNQVFSFLSVVAFLSQALCFTIATTRFWLSKFEIV